MLGFGSSLSEFGCAYVELGLYQLFSLAYTGEPHNNAAELAKIQSGQLYLVRPTGPRSGRECMSVLQCSSLCYRVDIHDNSYNDAMATVRRAPSVEYNYQLVITRVFEDGEEDILDEEEESESSPPISLHSSLIMS